jgi:Integrase core domain
VALATRPIRPGLVHHSDRGVQYASQAYTNLLQARGSRSSVSRMGNPYDNAQAESFMKTFKYEEVYLFEYQHLAEARQRIGQFIEEVYKKNDCTPPWDTARQPNLSGSLCDDFVLNWLSHLRGSLQSSLLTKSSTLSCSSFW